MGLLSRIAGMRNAYETDEFLDDDYGDYDDYDDYDDKDVISFKKGKMKVSDSQNSKSFFGGGPFGKRPDAARRNNEKRISMLSPSTMQDAKDICDALLADNAVIVNLENTDKLIAQRITDFVLGAVYSIEGDFRKITDTIFIASPYDVELTGEFV